MKIGDVARELNVAVHVLRHWDEVGAVVPDRSPSGHRDYTDEHLRRLRVLMSCREAGIGLADIRAILHRGEPDRVAVIEHHLDRVRQQRAQLDRTEKFLAHVVDCRHSLLTRCADCSRFGS